MKNYHLFIYVWKRRVTVWNKPSERHDGLYARHLHRAERLCSGMEATSSITFAAVWDARDFQFRQSKSISGILQPPAEVEVQEEAIIKRDEEHTMTGMQNPAPVFNPVICLAPKHVNYRMEKRMKNGAFRESNSRPLAPKAMLMLQLSIK